MIVDSKMIPIDIVLTTWKREWQTELCLRALKKNTWGTPYRLIIIDNGSTREAQELYLTMSDIYIKMDKNYGLERVKNIGMQFVESEYFVSTDNDILPYYYDEKDWLARLIEMMDKNPQYGAIAPKPQILVADSMRMFETEDDIVRYSHVPGYMRIMRTGWVNQLGAWRDMRPGRGHEELWIAEKFAPHNILMGWANKVGCWHLFGKEDTDMWGYPKGMAPEDHGHNPVWPIPKNDKDVIKEKVGIEI